MSLIMTQPIARRAIWGGKTLRTFFRFPGDFGDDVGQAWAFSAQESAPSPLCGPCEGMTLLQMWTEQPELFRSRYDRFPYIISLVAPEDDLSIQVHPDDQAAQAAGYPGGKNEAWVFLRAPEGGEIIYDHHAADPTDLAAYIDRGAWMELVRSLPVAQGDTVYIPAGTLHALRKGSIVYEIQQATDVTYRFYDYDRTDAQGCKRPLHLGEAIASLHYEHPAPAEAKPAPTVTASGSITETLCVQNDSFTVRRFDLNGTGTVHKPMYLLATVVAGEGTADGIPVHTGVSFLIPAGETVTLEGQLTLLTTSES